MTKHKLKTWHWLVIALILYIVLRSSPSQRQQRQYTAADIALFTSADNLLPNVLMETFCVENADGKSYTNDGSNIQCSFSYSSCDGTTITAGTAMQPYNWDYSYGCGMYKYSGSETPFLGTSMMLLKKSTVNGNNWYGFGYKNLPVTAGNYYRAIVMAKRLSKSGDDRDCSFRIDFKDAGGASLTSTDTISSDLGKGAGQWEKVEAIALAPSGATKAEIMMWCPAAGLYEYLLDGQYFAKYNACSPGETRTCGNNVGVCQTGVQICQANGAWGTCTGGVQPVMEVCSNSLDDDCDGTSDEYCSYGVDLTQAQWKTKYDTLNANMHGGQGTSDSNSPTYWAWDNAPIVESYLDMYSVTRDTKYLDYTVANTDRIISKAVDGNNDGYLDWDGVDPDEQHPDPILTYSRTLLPMAKFAYTVKRDGLSQYYTKANEYVNFIETNFIPVYDARWGECGEAGAWLEGDHSAPNNRQSYVGRIHLYLYLIKGDAKYLNQAQRYATKVKSTLITRTDGPTGVPFYFWHYHDKTYCKTYVSSVNGNTVVDRQCSQSCAYEARDICAAAPGDWSCSGGAEVSYTNYDLMFMLDAYRAGIVFNSQDITLLANSIKETMLTQSAVSSNMVSIPVLNWAIGLGGPRTDLNPFDEASINIPHWPILGAYDSTLKQNFLKMIKYQTEFAPYTHVFDCVDDLRDINGLECNGRTGDTPGRTTPAYLMAQIASYLNPIPNDQLIPLNEGACIPSWTYTSYGACVPTTGQYGQGTQTRTATDSNNCGTTLGRDTLTQSCCLSNWQCTAWSTCTSGTQTRVCQDGGFCGVSCTDTAVCGTTQSCTDSCSPEWVPGAWSACVSGTQTRTVTDAHSCGITEGKPPEIQTCTVDTTSRTTDNTMLYVIAAAFLFLMFMFMMSGRRSG